MENTYDFEKSIAQAKQVFNEMTIFVKDAGSMEPHQVEEKLMKGLLVLGRHLLQAFFDEAGRGDVGDEVVVAQDETLEQCRLRDRDYISVFGAVLVTRWYYWKSGLGGVCPLDGMLNMPERAYSYYLQEMVTLLSVRDTYDETAMLLKKIYGLLMSPRSIMDILLDVSKAVEDFRDAQPPPNPLEEKEVLVVSLDGKGVPMRKEKAAKKKVRLQRGEKRQTKKMSAVAAVYSIERQPRSAQDVLGENRDEGERKPSPRPYAKRVRARLGNKVELMPKLRREASLRESGEDTIKVFIGDGERQIWKLQEKYFADYIGVLDLYHVMEKLWKYAHCFHPEGSEAAAACVTERLRMLLEGNVNACIGRMIEAGESSRLSAAKKKTIGQIAGYFKRNASRMQYDRYLSMGIPIGSGNVESACKNLVKDRMEGTCMRWSKRGAVAMLNVRALHLNGDLGEYFVYHIAKQKENLYGKQRYWRRKNAEQHFKPLQLVA